MLSRTFLNWAGLRIVREGRLPDKCVIPVVPHTSNWDFPVGLSVRNLLDEKIHFVGKDSLFRWPLGPIMRRLGGVPVDRSKRNNFVQAVADLFEQRKTFRLSMAPEGTRSKVDKLKTGFYYIALEAKVPIVLCAFDWQGGEVRFSDPFMPSGDIEKDLEYIYSYFEGAVGFRPNKSFQRSH